MSPDLKVEKKCIEIAQKSSNYSHTSLTLCSLDLGAHMPVLLVYCIRIIGKKI